MESLNNQSDNPSKMQTATTNGSSNSFNSVSSFSAPESGVYACFEDAVKDYKLGSLLGEGSFGRVIKATHKPSGEKFAIKIIENILLCD